jgi:hypothetical protein
VFNVAAFVPGTGTLMASSGDASADARFSLICVTRMLQVSRDDNRRIYWKQFEALAGIVTTTDSFIQSFRDFESRNSTQLL